MMTIKEFAKLCGCNTQTLRYYDRIDLLRPVKVDEWTGYRYYEKNQALDYVKIKNLQLADFTIEEIKKLLVMSDDEVAKAFEEKIVQQREKLERILQIQKSYLKEKDKMEKAIQSMTDFLTRSMSNEASLTEFGFQKEDGEKVKALVCEYLADKLSKHLQDEKGEISLKVDDDVYTGAEKVTAVLDSMAQANLGNTILIGTEKDMDDEMEVSLDQYELVYEKHQWEHVIDFIDELPKLSNDKEYSFKFELTDDFISGDIMFPMCMMSAMIIRNDGIHSTMGVSVNGCKDSTNHFWMYQKDRDLKSE